MRIPRPPRVLGQAQRYREKLHQKLRRSLHRGSSEACSKACSESTHLTILTMWGRGSQRRQVVAVAQGSECWGAPGISALFCYTLRKPSLFTRVTLLWSSGAAPGVNVGLVSRTCRRGTGAARDQHSVDLPGYVAL